MVIGLHITAWPSCETFLNFLRTPGTWALTVMKLLHTCAVGIYYLLFENIILDSLDLLFLTHFLLNFILLKQFNLYNSLHLEHI